MENVSRHGVISALFLILVLSPVSSDADFLVEFQNGRTVRVEGYRIDGKSCELYLGDGCLRVPREEIRSIKEKKDNVERLPKEQTEKDQPKTTVNLGEQKVSKNPETSGIPGEQKLSKNPVPQGAEIESYVQRKAQLRNRLEEAKKIYFDATEKSEKDSARQRMISVSRELFSLEAEVKEKHNGSLPDWWKEN